MENSIESIWKNGFLKEDALIAPRLNDLYNQKSKNVVDKLFEMGRNNLIIIMIGAVLVFGITAILGVVYAGLGAVILLAITVYYGKKQGDKVKEISKGLNSYQYLLEVKDWLQKTIDGYTMLYRFIYPAFAILFTLGIWFSGMGEEIFTEMRLNSPDLITILGVPVLFWGVLVAVSGLLSVFAKAIYMVDLNLIYGGVFKKIDTLISEMEELRLEK